MDGLELEKDAVVSVSENVSCSNVSGARLHFYYEKRHSNYRGAVHIQVKRETGSYVTLCVAAVAVFVTYLVWTSLHGCSVTWSIAGLAGLAVALLCALHWIFTVTSETILVVSDIGMQVTQRNGIGMESSWFFGNSDLKEIVINEGITMHRTIFYLVAIVGRDGERLVPLFMCVRPRLLQLQLIRRLIRSVLYLPGQ